MAAPPVSRPESRVILGTRVDATSYAEAVESVLALAEARAGGAIVAANVHVVMEAFDDPALQRAVNSAERVVPDGMPLVWALRRLGVPEAERVYGPSLTQQVCEAAARRGVPVGFYGSSWPVLSALVERLTGRLPALQVAYAHSPPFRPLDAEEERKDVEAIEASGARILFVGLGCPKQERWIAERREALSAVLLGVGAAFDFLAGAKRQAPDWMARRGLEWLFRLASEPRRLWRRYLIQNPRFLLHFARERRRAGRFGAPAAPSRGR
jgi:N-acetylglucosaminyldiphosphoundecaprenol N-acetyl-beta-D-mannosaminyltransferase